MSAENEFSGKQNTGLVIFGLFVIFVTYFSYTGLVEANALPVDNVISLDISDNGGEVAISKQETLEITLQSDLINGYQWMLDTTSLKSDVLSEVGAYNSSDGQNQYIRWVFRPNDSGFSRVKLCYTNLSDNTIFEAFKISVSVLADPNERPVPFSLVVQPNKMNDVIAGQKCVYLVKVADEGTGYGRGEPVNISTVSLMYDTTVLIEPNTIIPGQVGEVVVIPGEPFANDQDPNAILLYDDPGDEDPNETDSNEEPFEYEECVIIITAERNGVYREEYLYLNVYPSEEDSLEPLAAEYRDRFIPYLAVNYPELGITEQTTWKGTIVRPRYLVVTYYLFFSEQWEMGLRWHVTIPPDDWAEIYLRKRGEDLSSTYAFRIRSVDAQDEPQVVDLFPEGIFR